MRILMVTPYPPVRDGLANYAVQEVQELRSAGHDVEVLSPGPSAAHHHLDLRGPRGAMALGRRLRGYDRVIVQYHPAIFYPQEPASSRDRTAVSLALAGAFWFGGNVELRVHEFPLEGPQGGRTESAAARSMWSSARRVSVHTEPEREQLASAFGIAPERIEVVHHGAAFARRTELDRAGARLRLDLPTDGFMFLSIGFIQPHKGFDRAVRAFSGLDRAGCRIDVVGSLRLDEGPYGAHLDDLRDLVGGTPGAFLHEGYVSDELFDVWIVACDALVLPYRLIWSSGVCERARLYDRPVIAARVGGLEDQGGATTVLVDSDVELAVAMRRLAGVAAAPSTVEPWPGPDRHAVMTEIRRRAAARRPSARKRDGSSGGTGSDRNRSGAGRDRRRSAPLRRVPPLGIPVPESARPGAAPLKRLVRRATAWEVDPVVAQVNALQHAMIEALEGLDVPDPSGATGTAETGALSPPEAESP